jgi:8-amino-7-oxononanoate synthase
VPTNAPIPLSLPPRLRGIEDLRIRTPMYDAVIEEVDGRRIRVGDRWLVDWASCNYLGFDLDEEIMAAIAYQIGRWGTHPGWSRMLGNPRLYPQIEERLTALLHANDTLLLPTISQIHESVIPVLADQGTVLVASDAHKTIYDGCQHARGLGATVHRFTSGDLQQLADRLTQTNQGGTRLVCIDGVNSMTGNIPDLVAYAQVCREHGALLYVDDAHGFGILGERRADEGSPYGWGGNAVVRHCGESYDNIVLVGGFSKAYSSMLAFLAVPAALKNHLKVAAAPYLYSGPSPIASLASALAGLEVNATRGEALRARLYGMTRRVLEHVRWLGVRTLNRDGTPIIELPIASDRDLVGVASELWRRDLYVTLAPYPGVPYDQVGFRIQVTAAHTDAQVDALLHGLTGLAHDGALQAAGPEPPPRAGD